MNKVDIVKKAIDSFAPFIQSSEFSKEELEVALLEVINILSEYPKFRSDKGFVYYKDLPGICTRAALEISKAMLLGLRSPSMIENAQFLLLSALDKLQSKVIDRK